MLGMLLPPTSFGRSYDQLMGARAHHQIGIRRSSAQVQPGISTDTDWLMGIDLPKHNGDPK